MEGQICQDTDGRRRLVHLDRLFVRLYDTRSDDSQWLYCMVLLQGKDVYAAMRRVTDGVA